MTTNDPSMATAAVRKLVEDSGGLEEFGGPWREIPISLYEHKPPASPDQAAEQR